MSVVGFDFGNLSLLIGQTSKGGVDVILNDASNRQTSTYVSIQGKQRFLGDSAAALARSNINNTISCMKLLVGRDYDCLDVQNEIKKQSFQTKKLPSGGVGIVINYDNKEVVISAEHAMGMMLVKAKEIAFKANKNVGVGDAVLAVPFWFSDSQRKGILNACEIASLNCLKVANESCLIALSYGIFKSAKKLFSETIPVHVMFIDLSYSGYCVSIVGFIQENMNILSTVCERSFGGRDFDEIIIEYLADTFQKKTGINVRNNKVAILKLQVAAEKAKKTLSPSGVMEANISVECLADDKDLSCNLTREEFETRCSDLVNKLEAPILECLNQSKLGKQDISEIEIVGGTSRVNIIKRRLGEILGVDNTAVNYGLKTTMNSDEAVARGGALQCAMLSSRLKVRSFNIIDRVSYNMLATFEGEDNNDIKSVLMYSSGDPIPSKPKRLTFKNKSNSFTIKIFYDETYSNVYGNKLVAQFHIKIPHYLVVKGDNTVRVTFNIDKNNCIYCQSAQIMEEMLEKKVEKKPIVSKDINSDNKIDADIDNKSSSNHIDESVTKDSEKTSIKDRDDDKDNNIEKEEIKEEIITKKYKTITLTVETESIGLTRKEIISACDLEQTMSREDKLIVETANIRNDLESFIYGMKDKINSTYKTYCTDLEKNNLTDKLNAAEEWLYNDGFDSTKDSYSNKIEGLRSFFEFLDVRMKEFTNRPGAIENFKKQINLIYTFAANNDEAHDHILENDRDFLRLEAKKSETWLNEQIAKQGKLLQNVTPILTCDIISKKRNLLFNLVNPILTRPKPKPVPDDVAEVDESSPSPEQESIASKDDSIVNKDEKEIDDKDNSSPIDT